MVGVRRDTMLIEGKELKSTSVFSRGSFEAVGDDGYVQS